MADEAERMRAELDALLYAVSHDLRAPLRAIAGFAAALAEEHEAALDDSGRRYLSRITSAVGTLNRQLDGLLELSRVERTPVVRRDVDFVGLVRLETESRGVRLAAPDAIPVYGDARLLRKMAAQLVDNACKFATPGRTPRVALEHERRGPLDVVRFADNGVGFDGRHADRLFKPFARLHGETHGGAGIGLALARRIIEKHDGWIRIESEPQQGTTVIFALGGQANAIAR